MDRQTGPVLMAPAGRTDYVSFTRDTHSGRRLRYELNIIQQPQRARACGAGAKASADRRPVDPPPILSLRIFDATNTSRPEEDITVTYQANFFAYVSLKSDRRYAQPRNLPNVNHEHKKDCLAGQTVASASHYERPTPAQYFIFPDLSVRHEGKYFLEFQLYEGLKYTDDETRGDLPPPGPPSPCGRGLINSESFDVYSAKRFPGLTESTPLSRQLAEQGSRIRIRRDVRMRKQDTKAGGKAWEGYDDDGNNDGSRMGQTPDAYGQQRQHSDVLQRPQSSSSRAHDPLSRRTSLNDLSQPYLLQQPGHQSQLPVYSSQAPPPFNNAVQQPYAQQSFMHPPAPQYSYQQPAVMSQQQNCYPYNSAPQQLSYPTPFSATSDSNTYQARSSSDFGSIAPDSRRTSVQPSVTNGTANMYSQQPAQASSGAFTQPGSLYPDNLSQPSSLALLPQQPQAGDVFSARPQATFTDGLRSPSRTTSPLHAAKSSFGTKLPPLSTTVGLEKMEAASPLSAAPNFGSALHTPIESNKRAYGSTFNTGWQNLANKHGARPGDSVFSSSALSLAPDTETDGASDTFEAYDRPVTYRRAGGGTATRNHI